MLPNTDAILTIAAHLRGGGLALIPTATGYALGGNPFDAAAIQALFGLKGRPADKPLLLLCRDFAQARALVRPPDDCLFSALAYRFWPGPLTVIAPAHAARLAPGVAGADGTLALRVDGDPELALLLNELDFPLTGTSANPSGAPTARSATTASDYFPDLPLLDGGPCPSESPSTLIRLTANGGYELLRPGAVPQAELDDFFKSACHTG